jgi:threonylcarbamoyladenosine tRNA methylthiotransferase MtaB
MSNIRKKVAFHTLGCKLNFAETSHIARSLPEELFERVKADEMADVYIINTCSVTDAADRKCRQAIKKFITRSPDAFIVVVGCYAQLKPQEITAIEGVDLVLGSNEKFDLASWISGQKKNDKPEIHSNELTDNDQFHSSWSSGDRTRSFLKVQDGCDYGCSYCTIPMARGNSRNPSVESVISEAKAIAASGVKEIVLTGVNIGDFGRSTGESFLELARQLKSVEGISRVRLSSIEPNLLIDDLIDLVAAGSPLLPHFHIPLQSGSDKILGLMRRRYRRNIFAERVLRIKETMPLAGIGADVIVGFPGETSADFEDTYNFIESLPVTYLHIFTYSERPGTIAAKMDGKIDAREKEQRSKMLSALSDKKNKEFMSLNIGHKAEILFERSRKDGKISGFTGNYLKAEHSWANTLQGAVKQVEITGISTSGNLTVKLLN